MKTILTAVAVLGLTLGGAAMAPAQVQLAAGGGSHPEADTDARATQLAFGAHPQADTDSRATQLAFGAHPQAETNERATQLAASGLDSVRQSHGEYV
jgi:hypothetical protein